MTTRLRRGVTVEDDDYLFKDIGLAPKGSLEEENQRLREKLKLAKEKLDSVRADRNALQIENELLQQRLAKIHILSEYIPPPPREEKKSSGSLFGSDDREDEKNKREKKDKKKTEASKSARQPVLTRHDTNVHSVSSAPIDRAGHTAAANAAAAAAVVANAKRDPLCLHNAAYESNFDLLKHLVEEGADINYRDKNNWTPLHCCSSTGQLGMCELLLAQKSITVTGIFAVNNDGNTALHYLVRMHPKEKDVEQYLRVLKQIVDKGADANLRNKNGETPLHAACFKGNKIAVSFLLQRGSNPNITNAQGETTLHYAVRANAKDLAIELLRFGADPKIAGSQLQGTPLDIAQKANQHDLVALFKDPKYAMIPLALHSIALDKYVPQFVMSSMDVTAFKNITDEQLQQMNLPEEARRKILAKTKALREAPEVNLEELEWEILWDDIQIEKEIGRGNYGIILKGKWKGEEVAVKQLKNPNPQLVEEFMSEIEVMKHVRLHENVVNLLGVCKTPQIAIISEFLQMGSLDKLLPTLEIDEETIVRFSRGAASGMMFLHEQNIIHRDIACRNLLASKNAKGELIIKVADFGMSRFSQVGVVGLEKNPNAAGPLKWMAPEALSYQYVKKTDVWSYGVALIEMHTRGGDPYPGETPLQVALAVRDDGRVPTLPPNLSPEIASLMSSCWKFNPDDRPSFDDIVTRLDQYHFKLKRQIKSPTVPVASSGGSTSDGHLSVNVAGDNFEVGLKSSGQRKK